MRFLFKNSKSFAEAWLSTFVVAGFPLVGKTYLANLHPNEYIDLDSSQFRNDYDWPTNYISKILMEWDVGGSSELPPPFRVAVVHRTSC